MGGSADPEVNHQLEAVLKKVREQGVPKDNIEKALAKVRAQLAIVPNCEGYSPSVNRFEGKAWHLARLLPMKLWLLVLWESSCAWAIKATRLVSLNKSLLASVQQTMQLGQLPMFGKS